MSYASTWGLFSWVIVSAVILLTLAPIVAAMRRSALPSMLAAVALPILLATNMILFWSWVPAWAAVLAAAIAGPPSREAGAKSTANLRV